MISPTYSWPIYLPIYILSHHYPLTMAALRLTVWRHRAQGPVVDYRLSEGPTERIVGPTDKQVADIIARAIAIVRAAKASEDEP